jgi:hypothetical protein
VMIDVLLTANLEFFFKMHVAFSSHGNSASEIVEVIAVIPTSAVSITG